MDFFKDAPLYLNFVVMSAVYLVRKAQHKVGSGEGNFSTALQSFTLCPLFFIKGLFGTAYKLLMAKIS
jgi:hypothetical protein